MAARNQPAESPSRFWDVMIKAGAVVAFGLLVACLAIPLRPKLAEYRALNEEGKTLQQQKEALERDIARRENELQMLERDPQFVEMKARDTLNMCQPGEVVFQFQDSTGAD